MKSQKNVIDLLIERFDRLEQKVDQVTTSAMPDLLTKVAVMMAENKKENQFRNRIYGGITLVVSICGLAVAAVAYFKN